MLSVTTLFGEIYERFLSQITEYDFIELSEEELEEELEIKLELSLSKLHQFKDVELDKENKSFTRVLTSLEKTIIAQGLMCEWLSTKVFNVQNMRNHMASKDFTIFSNANHLKELIALHTYAINELNYQLGQYALTNIKFK